MKYEVEGKLYTDDVPPDAWYECTYDWEKDLLHGGESPDARYPKFYVHINAFDQISRDFIARLQRKWPGTIHVPVRNGQVSPCGDYRVLFPVGLEQALAQACKGDPDYTGEPT